MSLDVRKLGDALGAEIIGFDLLRDLNEDTATEINRAWAENCVLCFGLSLKTNCVLQ